MNNWTLDEFGCWNLYDDIANTHAHVWIQKRPAYCDRGHWIANVDGISTIDGADAFPRYFMNLERAKLEMEEWLAWRVKDE